MRGCVASQLRSSCARSVSGISSSGSLRAPGTVNAGGRYWGHFAFDVGAVSAAVVVVACVVVAAGVVVTAGVVVVAGAGVVAGCSGPTAAARSAGSSDDAWYG